MFPSSSLEASTPSSLQPRPAFSKSPAARQMTAASFGRSFGKSIRGMAHQAFQVSASSSHSHSRLNIDVGGRVSSNVANSFEEMLFGQQAKDLLPEGFNTLTARWMVHPSSGFRRLWDLVTMVLVVILLFWVPFDLGFNFGGSRDGSTAQQFWWHFDLFMDIFFIVDLFLNFRTAILDDGELIQEPKQVARKYAKTWFAVDLIATIPYDRILIPLLNTSRQAALVKLPRFLRFLRLIRLMRLMRLMKLRRLLDQWEEFGVFAGAVWRLFTVLFAMVAVGHVLGCGWFFVADLNGLGMDTWAGEFNLQSDQATFVEKYTVSVYWAFVTVTTVGYGDVVPVSNSERQFVIFCTFIGNLAFAYMIGKMTAMAARVNASGQQFTAKMDAVNEFMRHHMLPKQLRKRIRAYYDTFWAHGIYFNERKILAELSFSLRRDVDFYLKREIILTVPFFQDADQNFIAELISMLDLKHCQAEELLIQEGEIGHEMYIIKSGEVVVLGPTGLPSHHLGDGAFFGEVCLLDSTYKRTATVRAVQPCVLYTLSKASLDVVLEHYPAFRDAMLAIAAIRVRKADIARRKAAIEMAENNPDITDIPHEWGVNASVADVSPLMKQPSGRNNDVESMHDFKQSYETQSEALVTRENSLAADRPTPNPVDAQSYRSEQHQTLPGATNSAALPYLHASDPSPRGGDLVGQTLQLQSGMRPKPDAATSKKRLGSARDGRNASSERDTSGAPTFMISDAGSSQMQAATGLVQPSERSVRSNKLPANESVHSRRLQAQITSLNGSGLLGTESPRPTLGSLLPSKFQQCARLLARKHKVKKTEQDVPVVAQWRRKRAHFNKVTLGYPTSLPKPNATVGTIGRLELLETALLDLSSKVDLLLASQGLRHPTTLKQGFWPQPEQFARPTWQEVASKANVRRKSRRASLSLAQSAAAAKAVAAAAAAGAAGAAGSSSRRKPRVRGRRASSPAAVFAGRRPSLFLAARAALAAATSAAGERENGEEGGAGKTTEEEASS